MAGSMRKSVYRMLLVLVVALTVVYTLGLLGVIPFIYSTYVTIFFLLLFVILRRDYHSKLE